jgi:hypothetical protein
MSVKDFDEMIMLPDSANKTIFTFPDALSMNHIIAEATLVSLAILENKHSSAVL